MVLSCRGSYAEGAILEVGSGNSEVGRGSFVEKFCLFVCVEVLRHSQQLRSCLAGQLPINSVPGQA